MTTYIWTVTRHWESGFGPTEQDLVGVYSNAELAYAGILRHIIAEHQEALDLVDPDGSSTPPESRMHGADCVRFSLSVWDINSGTCEHRGVYR